MMAMKYKVGNTFSGLHSIRPLLFIFMCPLLVLSNTVSWAKTSATINGHNPVLSLELQTPRNFGYVIGDEIDHKVALSVAKPFYLETEFLPKAGLLVDGLQIRQIRVEQQPSEHSTNYLIYVRYLLLFGGKQPERTLTIPEIKIRLYDGTHSALATVPKWFFVFSPLIPFQTKDAEVLIQPPVSPPILDLYFAQLGLWILGTTILILLFLIAWQHNLLPFLNTGESPFQQAYRSLKKRSNAVPSPNAYREALIDVHRAFDKTAGKKLFADQLAEFFDNNPRFASLSESTEIFFRISRQTFFGQFQNVDLNDYPVKWMENLCRQFRKIERRP